MRAEDHVHVIDVREEPLAISLGDASTHSDDPRAGRWSRKALARIALAVKTLIGRLANAAGHEYHDIRASGIRCLKAAAGIKQTGDALGVVQVHLATERADEIRLAGKRRPYTHHIHVSRPWRHRIPDWLPHPGGRCDER